MKFLVPFTELGNYDNMLLLPSVCPADPSIVSPTVSTITNNKSFDAFIFELNSNSLNRDNPTIHFYYSWQRIDSMRCNVSALEMSSK